MLPVFMNIAARRNILFYARLRRGNFFDRLEIARFTRDLYCMRVRSPRKRCLRTQFRGQAARDCVRREANPPYQRGYSAA